MAGCLVVVVLDWCFIYLWRACTGCTCCTVFVRARTSARLYLFHLQNCVRCQANTSKWKADRITASMMKTPSTANAKPTVIICPGNGCTNILHANWYAKFHGQLGELGIQSVCQTFPDPNRARIGKWLPFIRSKAEEACPDDP